MVETKFKKFKNSNSSQGTSFSLGTNEGVLSGCGDQLPGGSCDPTLGLANGVSARGVGKDRVL